MPQGSKVENMNEIHVVKSCKKNYYAALHNRKFVKNIKPLN